MEVRPYGPAAWLLAEVDDPAGMRAAVLDAFGDEVDDVVAAERSVIVRFPPGRAVPDRARLATLVPRRVGSSAEVVVIPVRYDGEDLEAVAAGSQMTVEEVVERHSGADYRVAFCGFSPGFAYLTGLDPALHLPRRDEPRTRVPAGSVAIAAHYAAVYPTASPGGWHLLGSTDLEVWDIDRTPPAMLAPGTLVRFEAREH